jgi:beta-xylosidase
MDLRKWSLASALAAALLGAGCAIAQTAPAPAAARTECRQANPVFAGADPHAVVIGDHYWVYTTARGTTGGGDTSRMHAYRSPDLRCWTDVGPVFTSVGVGWLDDGSPWRGLWAPGLAQANGALQLYYSVGPQAPQRPSRLGLAVARSPSGPFKDTGGALLTGGDGFEAIDPMVFTDPKSGVSYLYIGGSAGGTLRVFELNRDMSWFKREIPVTQQLPFFTEGPFVHERNGVYYLSYSHGSWNRDTYSAHYATGPSPTGPWTYRGVLLHSQGTRRGPGHHSIVRNPRTDEWFIVYHRWETKAHDPGPFEGDRRIAIQPLIHDRDGTLRRVDLDDNAVPFSPLKLP